MTFKNRYGITLAGDLYLPKEPGDQPLEGLAISDPTKWLSGDLRNWLLILLKRMKVAENQEMLPPQTSTQRISMLPLISLDYRKQLIEKGEYY